MIQLQCVTYTYPDAPQPALKQIDLTIRDGEWVLLAGSSGCGKSTLLHLLNGLIPHIVGGTLTGEIRIDGMEPARTPIAEISRGVGTVFQNPELQLFAPRVEDDAAFGCENLGFPPAETWRRVDRELVRMSLDEMRRQDVFTLSGGQKQRLAIAGALATGTRILLLDEPTSDLDQSGRTQLLRALRDLHGDGFTLVMTEHRFDGLAGLVDRALVMDRGRIVGNGPVPSACPPPPRSSGLNCQAAEVVVEADGLEFAYSGKPPVLRDVALRLRAGEVVALTGSNGSGKTTLLKILCGLLKCRNGRLRVAGVEQPALGGLAGKVGFLFQNPDEQIFTDRVADEILFGARNLGRSVDLDHYLYRTALADVVHAHPRSLSRGGRQRLVAAAVMAMQPQVVLLDEPTTGLDQAAWVSLMELVVEEAGRCGACVLFSTHHEEAAAAFASRSLRIAEGRLIDECLH
jgi:energy-coupling factor transporter ATP-binding protein EcfA2